MQIGVPREILAGETRSCCNTEIRWNSLKNWDSTSLLNSDAGALASFDNAAYVAAGASVASTEEIWNADIVF